MTQPAQPKPVAAPAKPVQPVQPKAVIPEAAAPLAAATTGAVQPGAVQPTGTAAVKPGAVKAKPTKKVAVSKTINPGDLICGQCAEGNDPARKFCRKCGASLQAAVVFKLPWYQRLWRALFGKRVKTAGSRPKSRRRLVGGAGGGIIFNLLKRLVPLAIVVIVILSFVGPWHKSLHSTETRYYHNVVNLVHPSYNQIHPVTNAATATKSAVGFPPTAVIDGATNSHWEAAGPNNGVGQELTIDMPAVTNVDKIGFLIGNQDGQATYISQPRPETVELIFHELETSKNAQGLTVGTHIIATKTITFKDTASFQTFTTKGKNVQAVTIKIESVYPAAGHNTSIAEVEFYKKS